MPEDPLLSFLAEPTPTTVEEVPYSTWSQENIFENPIESYSKYMDHIREQYVDAGEYNADIEKSITQNFYGELVRQNLVDPNNLDDFKNVDAQIRGFDLPDFDDQVENLYKEDLVRKGNRKILEEEEREVFKNYLAAVNAGEEVDEDQQKLVKQTFRENRNQILKQQYIRGEINAAVLEDEEGNFNFFGGHVPEGKSYMDVIRESQLQGTGVRLSDLPNLINSQKKLASYKNLSRADAMRLASIEGEVLSTLKKDELLKIKLDGLSRSQVESEDGFWDNTKDVAEGGLNLITGFALGLGEMAATLFGAEDAVKSINDIQASREIASKIKKYSNNVNSTRDSLIADLAIQTGASTEDVAKVVDQISLDQADFKFYDGDDLKLNIREGVYKQPKIHSSLLHQPKLLDKAIAQADLDPEIAESMRASREIYAIEDFQRVNELLQEDGDTADDWNEYYLENKRQGLDDHKILENFAETYDFNSFIDKTEGVFYSLYSGTIGTASVVIGAIAGAEGLKNYGVEVINNEQKRRQVGGVFGVEYGSMYDLATTAVPMVTDMAATVFLSKFTGGVGGALYAGAKASSLSAVRSVAKNFVKGNLRAVGGETYKEVAQKLFKDGAIKNIDDAYGIVKNYNSVMAKRIGAAPAVFIPAAHRSGAHTYAAVNTLMTEKLTQDHKNADGTWQDGWSEERVKKEAHEKGMAGMFFGGAFTGFLTAGFGLVGKGGFETSLLRGASYRQLKQIGQDLTNREISNVAFKDQLVKSVKTALAKHGTDGLRALGSGVLSEGIEESVDEFANSLIQDIITNESTPMMEVLNQTFHAFFLGGLLGGGGVAINRVAKTVAPNRFLDKSAAASFESEILEQYQKDVQGNKALIEAGAPETAEAAAEALSQYARAEPSAEEQAEKIIDPIAEDAAAEESANLNSDLNNLDREDVENAVNTELEKSERNKEPVDPELASSEEAQGIIKENGIDVDTALGKILKPHFAPSPQEVQEAHTQKEKEIKKRAEAWEIINRIKDPAERKGAMTSAKELGYNPLNPSQAKAALNKLNKQTERDLKAIEQAEKDGLTESDMNIVETLASEGVSKSLNQSTLKELDVKPSKSDPAFIKLLEKKVKQRINAKYPTRPVRLPQGGYEIPRDNGKSTLKVQSNGVGVFNNDPESMVTLLQLGVPVEVDNVTEKTNPAFKWEQKGDKFILRDVMVRDSGGMKSAATPNNNVAVLEEDFSELIDDAKRLNELNQTDNPNLDVEIKSPFDRRRKATVRDLIEVAKDPLELKKLLAKSNKKVDDLDKPFFDSAVTYLSVQLQLRFRNYAEALGQGLAVDLNFTANGVASDVVENLYKQQQARKDFQVRSTVESIDTDRTNKVDLDQDVDRQQASSDTYVPVSLDTSTTLSSPTIVRNYVSEQQDNAAAALESDPEMTESLRAAMKESGHGYAEKLSGQELFNSFASELARGGQFNKNEAVLSFQKRVRAGDFQQSKTLDDALFFLNLSHNSSISAEEQTIITKENTKKLKDKLSSLSGKKVSEKEATNFFKDIKKQVTKFLQRAVADKRSRKAVEAANESEVEELGLRDGSPDHVIKALEKISKGKNKVQAIIARVLLHNRALLKTIDFTLEKSSATYAGKYLVNNEGKGHVVINLSRTGGRGIADTLLHEYIHAFSSRITQLDPSQRTTAENNAIARLEGLLKIVRKQAAADKAPASIQAGLANVDEFISYFLTSPKFQGYIKSMTLKEGRSFFDRIIDAIARLFRQPTNEREYNAALRDVLDITKRGMLVREPDTSAGFRNQVADGVEQSQKERDEISKLIGIEADLRDLQMLDEKGAELEVFVGNYVPAEVAVFSNNNIPTIARWNPKTQSIEFNGRRAAAFINEALSNNGGYPINEEQVIAAIINEELAHAASFASLSQSSIDSLINSLDEAESKRIIEEYYPEEEQADALKRLESDDPQVVKNQKYILVEEMLRMFFQKKTRGTTTESEVAFLIEAPENLEIFKRYLKNTFKRLSYHKEQKDISPEMRNALKRVLNEVRRMEGGYRTTMNGMYFDASNPNATVNQLIDQLSRNKSIDSLDEDDIAPDLETRIGTTAIITAPLRVDELKNLSKQQMVKRAESAKYIHLQQAFDDIANAYNLSIDTRSPLIGGYLEEGQLSTEVPERVFVEGATEQELKDIGLLIKVLAPEIQHSTLLVSYQDEGTQGQEIEIRIKAKGAEKARLMGEDWLKDKNAGGFSFDPTTREIYTLLLNPFSEGDPSVDEQLNTWNTFVDEQKQKGNIFKNAVSETSYVSAEFVGGTSEEVRGEVQRIRDQASEENNTALLEVSERSLNRIDQDIEGEKIKQRAIDVLEKRKLSPLSSTEVEKAAEGKKFETIRDFGKFADDRLESIEGVRQLSEQADEGIDDRAAKAARPLVDDVLIGLSQSGSGLGWYDARVQATLHELTKIYPELAEDQNELAIFVGILATTSQGEPVVTNFKNASRVYEDYKATGQISNDYNFGKEKGAINLNLKFMQDLINRYQKETGLGKEYFREFMDSEILGGGLRDMFGDTPSGVTLSDKVVGARMLGPKIGSFFNNLRGRFDTITMDLWYTRTMHRYIGNSVLENDSEQALNAKEKFINTLRNSERTYDLNPDELEAMDFEGVYAAAKKVFNVWSSGSLPEAQGKTYKTYSDDSKFEKAARTVTTVSGMKAAPKNKSYSLFFERIVREAQSQLKDLGFDLNAADIQAILWFREKNLFLGLGLANSAAAPADYLDAAMVLRREKAQEVNEQTEEPVPPALETRFGAGKFPSDHKGLKNIIEGKKVGNATGIGKGMEGSRVNLSHTNITLGRLSRDVNGTNYDDNYPVGVMPYALEIGNRKFNAFNVRLKDSDNVNLKKSVYENFLAGGNKYKLSEDMTIEQLLIAVNVNRNTPTARIGETDLKLTNPDIVGKDKIPKGTIIYAQGSKGVVGGPAGTLVSYNEDIKDVAAEGIYINDSTQKFTDQILKGEKTVETRNKPTLDRFVGQRVGIIRSGIGKSVVVGYATIGDRIDYPTEKSFRADQKRHKVKKGSKFDTKGVKYGYELLDVTEEPNPYGVVESKSRQHALIAHSIAYNPAQSNYMYPVYGTKDGPVFEVNKEFVGADEVIMISDLGKKNTDAGINFMLVARGARFNNLTDKQVEKRRSSNQIKKLIKGRATPLQAPALETRFGTLDNEYMELAKNPKQNFERLAELDEAAATAAGYTGKGVRVGLYSEEGMMGVPSPSSNFGAGYYLMEGDDLDSIKSFVPNIPEKTALNYASWVGPFGFSRAHKVRYKSEKPIVINFTRPSATMEQEIEAKGLLPEFNSWVENNANYVRALYKLGLDEDLIDDSIAKKANVTLDKSGNRILDKDPKKMLDFIRKLDVRSYTEGDLNEMDEKFGPQSTSILRQARTQREGGPTLNYLRGGDAVAVNFLFSKGYADSVTIDWKYSRTGQREVIVKDANQIKEAGVATDFAGNIIPLSRRYNEQSQSVLETRFGASSYIPKSIGEADLDFSAMFESLDIPILEYGTFEQPSSRLKKALSGSTDRQVRRFVEERDAFVQTSKKIVKQFKDKFDADIERIENDKNVNIPKSLIARATGSTVGSQLSQDQLDDVSDKFEKDIKAARKIDDKSTREAAFIAAEEQRRKNITDYRQQNRDRLLEDRDKALKELSEVTDNSPDVVQLIINARAFMDELSKKGNDLFSDYLSDFDVQATFDGNLGIYITRRYRMFEDDAFADRVLTDPDYASVRDAALKFFSKIYFNQQVQYHILEGGMTRKVAKEMAMQDLTDANAMTVTPMQTMMEDFVKGYKRGDIAGGLRTFVGANQEEQLAIKNTTNISDPLKAYLDQIKKKHDVPVELRNLLGEVTGEESGLDNLLVSIVSTSSMMANQAMLNKMAHYGMQGDTPWMVSATDILNEKKAAAAEGRKSKYDGWVPIRKSQGSMDWNPVSDMYVEQEVYEGIKEIFEKPKQEEVTLFSNQAFRGLQQATGISLAAKTLGSVGFYIRNMASNGMYFGPMQGYYGGIGLGMKEAGAVLGGISHIDRLNGPVGDYVKGLKEDSMLVRAYRGSRATMDAELEFLASQNVWGDEVQAEVIRDFVEGKMTRNDVNQKIEEIAAQVKKLAPNGVHKVPSKAAKSVKSLTDFAARLASASDAYYKIGYYHFELGHLVEAANQDPPNGKYRKLLNEDGTPSTEMKKMAALKVKKTAQAYSQAPPIIREATNSPLGLFVGSYIRFAGETVRIPFNTWQLSKEEVADDNPVIQARGRSRRRGMMIVLGGLTVVLPQMMRIIVGNLDLDEEESLRNTMPEFLRRHTFLYTTFGEGLQSWDLTYLNPFASITDGFVRGAEHFIKGDFAKGMESILIDTFRPFTEEQILASAVLQAVQNKNQYDKPIYYEDDPVIEKFGKMFGHVLGGAFGLRTVQKLNETQIALRGDGEGFLNSPLGIIAAEFAPVKPHQVDLQRNIRNFLNQKAKEYRDITTKFNRLYQDKAMTTGQINDLYSDIQNSRRRLNETIFETMENFESIGRKHGGISRSDIERQAKITGMSKERYRLGRMGYMKTLRPSPSQKKKLDSSILGRSRSNQLKQLQREFGDTIPLDN